MSDINELIHKTSMNAYHNGVIAERTRIIELLEELKRYWSEQVEFEYGTVLAINPDQAIAAIRGEVND
jgi:hypothetical protein